MPPHPKLGEHEIGASLGNDGSGELFAATNPRTGQRCVAKVIELTTKGPARDDVLARFKSDVETLRKLDHPHVARILEVGHEERSAGVTAVYVVREHVEGRTLAQLVQSDGALPPKLAADMLRTVCAAIQAGHDEGILHGDIRPENVMLARNGRVVVLDSGHARLRELLPARGGPISTTTRTQAPEVLGGKPADVRSDVYSLGALLYHLVTGRHLRGNTTLDAVVGAHDDVDVRTVEAATGLPQSFRSVLAKAVTRVPTHRHPSPEALAEALRAHSDEPEWLVVARPTSGPTPPEGAPRRFQYRDLSAEKEEPRTSPLPLLVVSGLVVVGAILWQKKAPTPEPAPVVVRPAPLIPDDPAPPPPPT
ncbi:MAG: serine/threonine-protein kinase, partial [Myxococcota bacterium]